MQVYNSIVQYCIVKQFWKIIFAKTNYNPYAIKCKIKNKSKKNARLNALRFVIGYTKKNAIISNFTV